MGAGYSKSEQFALFSRRSDVVDWSAYAEAPWRSDKARELDKYGGVSRIAVPRGSSMTAKLQFLQDQVGAQASEIQHEFTKTIAEFNKNPRPPTTAQDVLRPLTRSGLEADSFSPSLAIQRGSGFSSAGFSSMKTRPTHGKLMAAGIKRAPDKGMELDRIRAKNKALNVAQWRMTTHDARRRAMMVIMFANRFLAGAKHPKRLRRVDSFSYYIPAVLQNDMKRFVSTSKKYDEAADREVAARAAAEAALLAKAAAEAAARVAAAVALEESENNHGRGHEHKKPYRPILGITGAGGMKKFAHGNVSVASSPARKSITTATESTPTSGRKPQPPSAPSPDIKGPNSGFQRAASTIATAPSSGYPEPLKPSSKSDSNLAASVQTGRVAYLASGPGALGVQHTDSVGPSSPTHHPLPMVPESLPTPNIGSPVARRNTLESLPQQQYQHANNEIEQPPSLPQPVPRLLEPLTPGGPFHLGTESKFGYKSAAGRALMPRRVKELAVEKHIKRLSDTGVLPGQDGSNSAPESPREFTLVPPPSHLIDNQQHLDLEAALLDVAAPVARSTQSCSGADMALSQAGVSRTEMQALLTSFAPEPPSQPNGLIVSGTHRQPGPTAGQDATAVSPLPPLPGKGVQRQGSSGKGVLRQGSGHSMSPDFDTKQHDHDFKHHVEKLAQKSVKMRLEEEAAESMAELAEDLTAAREKMRQDEAAAAQRALEEEWEVELRGQAQQEEVATVESTSKLLAMYVNRGNATWASARQWGPPSLWDRAKQEEWMNNEDWNVWKARTAYAMKAGAFAVQIHATGPGVHFPQTGRTFDIFTTDPWEMLHAHRNVSFKEHVQGVSMGIRILNNLVAAVEAFSGKEGVSKLTVMLHLTEEQFEKHLPMLRFYHFGGVDPKNMIVFVQRKRPGYKFDEGLQRFAQRACGHVDGCGTGHSLMQLNWVAEGFIFDKEGRPSRLLGTALEELQKRNVEWLVSQSANDLGLLTRESAMDLVLLPFLLSVHKAAGVNCITQVVREDSLGWAARTNGSIIMMPTSNNTRGSHARAALAQLPPSHPGAGLGLVMELRALELHSGSMKDMVRAGKHAGSHYLLGLDRHVIHLPELAATLTTPDVVRPKLLFNDGALHVKLDLSDVTGHDSIKTVAVRARQCPQILLTSTDLEEMLPLIRAQDSAVHFRKMLGSRRVSPIDSSPRTGSLISPGKTPMTGLLFGRELAASPTFLSSPGSSVNFSNPTSPIRIAAGSNLPAHAQGHNFIVFVSSNNVSHLAVEAALAIAKPGRDIIHLVTVVGGYTYIEGGQALLDGHYARVARALVEARQEVLVLDKEDPQLVACMEGYVHASRAEMVIMATKALNQQQLQASTILGSVTLAAIKRLQVPVLVVNGNSLNIQDALKHHTLKAMAVVNRHAGPLVKYMTDRLLQPARGDTLVLCRVDDPGMGGVIKVNAAGSAPVQKTAGLQFSHKDQQVMMMQRQLASMAQAATMTGLPPPVVISLEDDKVEDIVKVINKEGVHLMGYLLPQSAGKIPEQLVHMVHTCRCGVLVYKPVDNQPKKRQGL